MKALQSKLLLRLLMVAALLTVILCFSACSGQSPSAQSVAPPIGSGSPDGGVIDPSPNPNTNSDPDPDPDPDPDAAAAAEPRAGEPRVTVGSDRVAREGDSLILSSLSMDDEGSVVSWRWELLSGDATLAAADAATLDIQLGNVAEAGQTVVLKLTVTDDEGNTASDQLTIEVLDIAATDSNAVVMAGVAVVDAAGPVGASAGQYADIVCDQPSFDDPHACSGTGRVFPDKFDPNGFSSIKKGSYGVQSRPSVRALVIQGSNGKRVVLISSDNYLAQDLLQRRVAQILEAGASGIGYEQILHSASHNHSSPYQFTQAAGVWVFEDQYNAYVFERMARAMAEAIETAAAVMRPVRMSGVTVDHNIVKANIMAPTLAIDGTPAGYPRDFGDTGMAVLRFDDLTVNPPRPLAFWVNHGEHPESLDGYHLISADFVGPFGRFVERGLGAPLIFSQGDVGSAEGPYASWSNALPLTGRYEGILRAFAHEGYAQLERAGRILADAVIDANEVIEQQTDVTVPWSSDFAVDWFDHFVAGPISHPTPTLSNCNSQETFEGNAGVPAAGLPDCSRGGDDAGFTLPAVAPVLLGQAPGTPIPGHYSAPGHPAVFENQRIHLQAFKLGDVLLASCSCEPQVDLILNLESRADNVAGNIFSGYDWSPECEQQADDSWICPNPRNADEPITDIPNEAMQRMIAHVNNDAAGWEEDITAETEAGEPEAIRGNFTHEELPADLGFAMPIGVGHSGDYNGYTVSYREYVSRDHYRKALTAYGPHTADYMNTRLVRMAGKLNGGPDLPSEPPSVQAQMQSDEQRQANLAQNARASGEAVWASFEASLPADPDSPTILEAPQNITHFSAANFGWQGGGNGVDNPQVVIEQWQNGDWQTFGDMSGEVQSQLRFPANQQELNAARAGQFAWQWQAGFEAFPALPANAGTVPAGLYRFVVRGRHKSGAAVQPYGLISTPFRVAVSQSIVVSDLQIAEDGSSSFLVAAIEYPKSYESTFPVIADDQRDINCRRCSFRAWANSGEVVEATVTVRRLDGSSAVLPATFENGRWNADTQLAIGDSVAVPAGAVMDNNQQTNAAVAFVTRE